MSYERKRRAVSKAMPRGAGWLVRRLPEFLWFRLHVPDCFEDGVV